MYLEGINMIQIQPQYAHREGWMKLIEDETLRYEVLEFSSIHLNSDVPQEIVSWYKKSGIADSVHGAFIDVYPMSINFDVNEISRKKCENSCTQAKMIGAKNVVFHSTALPFCRQGLEKLWAQDAADYYQFLAEKFNLNILVENFNDVDFVPLKLMMGYVSDERVKICLDVAHANFSRVPVKKWFEEIGDYIGYLHLSDNNGEWDDHIVLGSGTTDLEVAHRWWYKNGKDIPITIEMKNPEDTRESIKYLKQRGLFGY